MSDRARRTGHEVLRVGQPRGAYGELWARTLSLGRLIIPRQVSDPIAPSTVYTGPHEVEGLEIRGKAFAGRLALELSIDYGVNPFTEGPEPKVGILTVSEVIPFGRWLDEESAELWMSQEVTLTAPEEDEDQEEKEGTVTWSVGTLIRTDNCIVTVHDEPPIGLTGPRHAAWRAARDLARKGTRRGHEDFMDLLTAFQSHIREHGV